MSEKEQTRINELIAMIKSNDDKEAGKAAFELCSIGRPAVAALILMLSDKEDRVRIRSALILGKIGTDAIEAFSYISNLLEDDNETIQLIGAVVCIELRIERDKALHILLSNLKSKDKDIRLISIKSIERSGNYAMGCIEELMGYIGTEDREFRNSIMRAIISIDDSCDDKRTREGFWCKICKMVSSQEYCKSYRCG